MRVDLDKRTSMLMSVPMMNPRDHVVESMRVFVPIDVYELAIVQYVYKVYGITGTREGIIALMHNFYAYDRFEYEETFEDICKEIYKHTEYRIEDYANYLDMYFGDFFEMAKNNIK